MPPFRDAAVGDRIAELDEGVSAPRTRTGRSKAGRAEKTEPSPPQVQNRVSKPLGHWFRAQRFRPTISCLSSPQTDDRRGRPRWRRTSEDIVRFRSAQMFFSLPLLARTCHRATPQPQREAAFKSTGSWRAVLSSSSLVSFPSPSPFLRPATAPPAPPSAQGLMLVSTSASAPPRARYNTPVCACAPPTAKQKWAKHTEGKQRDLLSVLALPRLSSTSFIRLSFGERCTTVNRQVHARGISPSRQELSLTRHAQCPSTHKDVNARHP